VTARPDLVAGASGDPDPGAARARSRSALFSVAAAVFLVALKLVTGLATGSLAFLAEAAHSATDLVAALLTLFAVRVAVRPPDHEHHYGHGKAEHLAALAESAVLLVVALAIGFESLHRVVSGGGEGVDATWWAFAVLAVVIATDLARVIASERSARRYGSPALAANAVHFASDLAGSLAVLVGLILVASGHPDADALAGLLVAALVIGLALRLLWQSVQVLMDRTSADASRSSCAACASATRPAATSPTSSSASLPTRASRRRTPPRTRSRSSSAPRSATPTSSCTSSRSPRRAGCGSARRPRPRLCRRFARFTTCA
jgi:cation diffusion facilitator family transporter